MKKRSKCATQVKVIIGEQATNEFLKTLKQDAILSVTARADDTFVVVYDTAYTVLVDDDGNVVSSE